MFLEIKFDCYVANSGYEFFEYLPGWVRPKDISKGISVKPLEEIAVFELNDLFDYLDSDYETGLPSRDEQIEILRFYNRWGFLGLPNDPAEPASLELRNIRDAWLSARFAPVSVDIKEGDQDIFGQPKLLIHALSLLKTRIDESSYTICEYHKVHGKPRDRRKGSCPPRCRVKRYGDKPSWGKSCQPAFLMEKQDRSKK